MYLPKFQLICEAYEVLSNFQLKAIYETYGEEVLRQGIAGPDGGKSFIYLTFKKVKRGGYVYKGNCYEIFDKYFMESNPFFELCTDLSDVKGTPCEIEGSLFGSAFGGMNQPLPEILENINIDVDCTLVEFFCGARKQVEYERQVIGLDGSTVRQEINLVNVFVYPGMIADT